MPKPKASPPRVTWQLRDEPDAPIGWSRHLQGKHSPYVKALLQLDEAGGILEFSTSRAAASIRKAAAKIGRKVLFHTTPDRKLWVKIDGVVLEEEPVSPAANPVPMRRRKIA